MEEMIVFAESKTKHNNLLFGRTSSKIRRNPKSDEEEEKKQKLRGQVSKVWIRNQTCKGQTSKWNFHMYVINLHTQRILKTKGEKKELIRKVGMHDDKSNEVPSKTH